MVSQRGRSRSVVNQPVTRSITSIGVWTAVDDARRLVEGGLYIVGLDAFLRSTRAPDDDSPAVARVVVGGRVLIEWTELDWPTTEPGGFLGAVVRAGANEAARVDIQNPGGTGNGIQPQRWRVIRVEL